MLLRQPTSVAILDADIGIIAMPVPRASRTAGRPRRLGPATAGTVGGGRPFRKRIVASSNAAEVGRFEWATRAGQSFRSTAGRWSAIKADR